MKRILTAAVGVPLALAAVYWLPGPVFFLATAIFFEIAVWEYARLAELSTEPGAAKPLLILVPLVALVLCPALWSRVGSVPMELLTGTALVILVAGAGIWTLSRRTAPENALAAMGAISFGTPYLALPLAALFHLRQLDPDLLVLLFAVVWLGDAAAYYVGSAWGRHKMAPIVSPNKTWEGALASVTAAVISAGLWSVWKTGELLWILAPVAVVLSISAQLGDLIESMLKRGAGVKDSGHLMPGHGGVLDRIDALLFAAPILWLAVGLLRTRGWLP